MTIYFKKNEKNYINNHEYIIYDINIPIGEIVYKQQDNIMIIGYVEIYSQYKGKHYGYQVIEHILNTFKPKCIIWEILNEAKGFGNKCINKYKGIEINISHSDNCDSSLIIPKQQIDEPEMKKLLEEAYWII